jgi:hypothetical protein
MTAKQRLADLKTLLQATFPTAQVQYGWAKSFPSDVLLITYTLSQKSPTRAIGNQRTGAWQTINLNIWTSTELQGITAAETFENALDKTEYEIVMVNTIHEAGIKLEWRKAFLLNVYEKYK